MALPSQIFAKYRFKKAPNKRTEIWQNASNTMIKRISGSYKAQKVYQSWKTVDINEFLTTYRKYSHIKHRISEAHIQRIPSEKALLVLANHPTGIPDGLLILESILQKRKDVKLITDIDTYTQEPLIPYTIGIQNDQNLAAKEFNKAALKSALDYLNEGHCIVLFSNSEVLMNKRLYRSDKISFWDETARAIIEAYSGYIIPWGIRGRNSALFYQLSKINPKIKAHLLPRESLKRRLRPIESVIGKPFKATESNSFLDLELKIRLMSRKKPKFQWAKSKESFLRKKLKPIDEPIQIDLLRQEISQLEPEIASKGANKIYLSPPGQSPSLLNEIGRLREITFRQVGEGTGKSRDLDGFDLDFYHLILWDSDSECIAGAYRLGMGPELHSHNNYQSLLYDFYKRNPQTENILAQSLLMGRAFVIPQYQQKPFPLFLLWQGILSVVKSRPEIKYIIGQTSLPNSYQYESKLLITEFLWRHFSDPEIRKYFSPFHELKLRSNPLISRWVELSQSQDIKRMDKIIECIEPNGAKTPMLFKRYIEQKARCIGINVDPDFQNSIDILMLTKVEDLEAP